MIERADFSRVLVGLEPVIQGLRSIEPVRCLGFDFAQIPSMGIASRFFLPTAEVIEWPTMEDLGLRNPLLPPWRTWPGELHQVPYPVEHRSSEIVAWGWPILEVDVATVEALWPSHRDESLLFVEVPVVEDPFWPAGELVRVAASATRRALDAIFEVESPSRYPAHPWLAPRVDARTPVPVAGDEQSHVPAETIATLVELARQDRYQDFVDLAGAVGVGKAEWDALWKGTRARVGAPVEEEDPPF